MAFRLPNMCNSCIHRDFNDANVCEAFPTGIPVSIRNGFQDHLTPFPGDSGINYQMEDGGERSLLSFFQMNYEIAEE